MNTYKLKLKSNHLLMLIVTVLMVLACDEDDSAEPSTPILELSFEDPVLVNVTDYNDHLMEPFLSRDGNVLFFNNLNNPSVNTNLHWATRISDTEFQYQGELENTNTESLEGVPSMDDQNQLYFISTRSYDQTLSTIYQGFYSNGRLNGVSIVGNVSRNEPGWVNFDVEVSKDGNNLYFVDGRFDEDGGPYESNFVLAQKTGNAFNRISDSDEIFMNINTDALEYAAAITTDELELCITRVDAPLTPDSEPRLYVSRRTSTSAPFPTARLIENITGFIEGATYTPNDDGMYFHKKDNDFHRLYFSKRVLN